MSFVLCFPPPWRLWEPYLSLPSLTAFLEYNGCSGISQKAARRFRDEFVDGASQYFGELDLFSIMAVFKGVSA